VNAIAVLSIDGVIGGDTSGIDEAVPLLCAGAAYVVGHAFMWGYAVLFARRLFWVGGIRDLGFTNLICVCKG
jgi:hypothetical protein